MSSSVEFPPRPLTPPPTERETALCEPVIIDSTVQSSGQSDDARLNSLRKRIAPLPLGENALVEEANATVGSAASDEDLSTPRSVDDSFEKLSATNSDVDDDLKPASDSEDDVGGTPETSIPVLSKAPEVKPSSGWFSRIASATSAGLSIAWTFGKTLLPTPSSVKLNEEIAEKRLLDSVLRNYNLPEGEIKSLTDRIYTSSTAAIPPVFPSKMYTLEDLKGLRNKEDIVGAIVDLLKKIPTPEEKETFLATLLFQLRQLNKDGLRAINLFPVVSHTTTLAATKVGQVAKQAWNFVGEQRKIAREFLASPSKDDELSPSQRLQDGRVLKPLESIINNLASIEGTDLFAAPTQIQPPAANSFDRIYDMVEKPETVGFWSVVKAIKNFCFDWRKLGLSGLIREGLFKANSVGISMLKDSKLTEELSSLKDKKTLAEPIILKAVTELLQRKDLLNKEIDEKQQEKALLEGEISSLQKNGTSLLSLESLNALKEKPQVDLNKVNLALQTLQDELQQLIADVQAELDLIAESQARLDGTNPIPEGEEREPLSPSEEFTLCTSQLNGYERIRSALISVGIKVAELKPELEKENASEDAPKPSNHGPIAQLFSGMFFGTLDIFVDLFARMGIHTLTQGYTLSLIRKGLPVVMRKAEVSTKFQQAVSQVEESVTQSIMNAAESSDANLGLFINIPRDYTNTKSSVWMQILQPAIDQLLVNAINFLQPILDAVKERPVEVLGSFLTHLNKPLATYATRSQAALREASFSDPAVDSFRMLGSLVLLEPSLAPSKEEIAAKNKRHRDAAIPQVNQEMDASALSTTHLRGNFNQLEEVFSKFLFADALSLLDNVSFFPRNLPEIYKTWKPTSGKMKVLKIALTPMIYGLQIFSSFIGPFIDRAIKNFVHKCLSSLISDCLLPAITNLLYDQGLLQILLDGFEVNGQKIPGLRTMALEALEAQEKSSKEKAGISLEFAKDHVNKLCDLAARDPIFFKVVLSGLMNSYVDARYDLLKDRVELPFGTQVSRAKTPAEVAEARKASTPDDSNYLLRFVELLIGSGVNIG